MPLLPTVLLRHEAPPPEGLHFDWLLGDPRTGDDAQAPLWTARVDYPSTAWAGLVTWELRPIAPHRRIYLTYEGAIGAAPPGGEAQAAMEAADRGTVIRVDEGTFTPLVWSDDGFVIDLSFRALAARVEAVRLDATLWRARLLEGPQ